MFTKVKIIAITSYVILVLIICILVNTLSNKNQQLASQIEMNKTLIRQVKEAKRLSIELRKKEHHAIEEQNNVINSISESEKKDDAYNRPAPNSILDFLYK